MGRLITWLDRRLNRDDAHPEARRRAGAIALLVLLVVVGAVAFIVEETLLLLPLGLLFTGVAASTMFSQRSLFIHVGQVADALDEGGLEAGRAAVAHIVGRDTGTLDQAGVARAAIESLAENFSDGVVAPAFWMVIAWLPGAALYKAINTADSMIGHRSDKYRAFGWAAARLDDLVNLPASRLGALLLILAAFLLPGARPGAAFGAVERDAGRHRSPNAGWPEAAMAGALGLKLAGPRRYGDVWVEDHWMGGDAGRAEAGAGDIRRALRLYLAACGLLAVMALLPALALLR
jgi:adenosylcobinamide-phosphate synthase